MICIAEGTLQAQLDGELTLPESLAVDRHLAECADCRRRAEEVTARCSRVHELVYELSPLPSEMTADPFLALARFKERLATEGGQATMQANMHTLTPIQQLDGHIVSPIVSHNGHRPGAKVDAQIEAGALNHRVPSDLAASTPAPGATLSFAIPESGNLITRLIATARQCVRDFGRPSPRLRPGDTDEFHFLLADESFLARLRRELIAAAQEFKRDPRGFLAATFTWRGEGGMPRRHPMMQAGAAMAVMAYAFIFTSLVIAGLIRARSSDGLKADEVIMLGPLIGNRSTPDPNALAKGKGDFAGGSKAKSEHARGGGGGGRNEETPASKGNLPIASLTPQIVMPNPLPGIKNPSLPVPMTVYVDPSALPTFRGGPIGLPNGVEGPPSSGPGKGAGIGNGDGTGVGPGRGGGVGPGENGNIGGDRMGIGHGGGKDVFEAGKNGAGSPKILYKERAKYTEEARLNKVQGTVVLSAIFTADGRILNIRVVRGLPDGLSETAIEAAQRIRFQPATKNGAVISVIATIEFTFSIY